MNGSLGRYEILEEIGQGGFAIVYRARDTELDRLVALKELRPILLQDASWVRRFRREAKTIARLDHFHIVTIYDVYEVEQRLFIVMRLVDGPSLDELITNRGYLSWAEAVEVMRAVAVGLDYAHAQDILHRDLKPANILMDPERGSMLTDFGLAKLASESSLSASASSSVVGTPHYIAPEVWEGKATTPQSDIYALGCILYEMLTGEKIFKGETPPAVMMAHFKPLVFPNTWPNRVPAGVVDVLRTALANRPAHRYASAGEMAEALTKLAEDKGSEPAAGSEVMVKVEEVEHDKAIALTSETPAQSGDMVEAAQPDLMAAIQPGATQEQVQEDGRARGRGKVSGCVWVSAIVGAALVGLVVVGLSGLCSALDTIVDKALPNVEVSSTVVDKIQIPLPNRANPFHLELNFGSGELFIGPGAQELLVEGTATYNVAQLEPEIITTAGNIRLEHKGGIGLAGLTRDDIKNRWDLTLGDIPLELVINTDKADGEVELGGLSVVDLIVHQGAATHFEMSFSEPNQVEMETFQFKGGATIATLTGLANTRAAEIDFEFGAGDYTLDFSGELQNDIEVTLGSGLSAVTILVPEDVAARLAVNGELTNIDVRGAWQRSGDDYVLPGKGYEITIDVKMDSGSLKLYNP